MPNPAASFVDMKTVTDENLFIPKNCLPRIDKVIALLFAVLVLVLGYGLIVKGVSAISHDDGIYIITAKAIAQGDGYRLIQMPDVPMQTKYPFLYPLILAMVWKLSPSFPANLLWMQLFSLLAGAATAAIAYLYLLRFRYASRSVAAIAVLMSVTSPNFLFFCSSCLSELPFALFLVAALWGLERHIERPFRSRLIQFLLGILLVLPTFCRTIGFVSVLLIVALALRHKRVLLWPMIGAVTAVLPFLCWTFVFSKWTGANSSNIYYTNYVTWWSAYGVSFIGHVLKSNARDIFFSFTPLAQLRWQSIPDSIRWSAVLIGIATVAGMARQVRSLRILPTFLVCYLTVVLVWPWPPHRFVMPVLPYLFACSITTIAVGFRRLKNPGWILRPVAYGLVVVLTILNLRAVGSDIAGSKANRYPACLQLENKPIQWSSYEQMFDWVQRNTAAEDILISGMDPMLYLYTGRRGVRPFATRPSAMFYEDYSTPILGPVQEVMDNIRYYKARYLVLSPMPGFAEDTAYVKFVVDTLRKFPHWLEQVYVGEDKRFVIYRIRYACS